MLPNYSIWITGGRVHINRPDHPESMVISEGQAAHHLMTYDDIRRRRDDLLAALEWFSKRFNAGMSEREAAKLAWAFGDVAKAIIAKARGQ
jgi:hypothetical protein